MDLDPSIKDEDLSSSHRGSSLERESDQEMDAFPFISDVRIIPKKKKPTADGVGDVDLSSSSRSSSLGRGGSKSMCKKAADAKAQLIEQENQKARVLPRNPRKRSPTVAEAKARHEIDQRRVILKDRQFFRACARQDD